MPERPRSEKRLAGGSSAVGRVMPAVAGEHTAGLLVAANSAAATRGSRGPVRPRRTLDDSKMKLDLVALCQQHPDKFALAGTVNLDMCPVCFGKDYRRIWQLPQSYLKSPTFLAAPGAPYDNTYISHLPMLSTPQEIFVFDMCQRCEAIFLNPKSDDQAVYERDESKVRGFRESGLDPWRSAAANYLAFAPTNTRTVVDAACGAGQMLAVLHEADPNLKPIGLEISRPSVAFMRDELGLESHVADLDRDDLDRLIPPGSVDYVIFNEAYEHVRHPTVALGKLLRILRPGGRIRYSAQAYGPDLNLQIRVGEPIFISAKTLEWTLAHTGAKLADLLISAKMYITLEKP